MCKKDAMTMARLIGPLKYAAILRARELQVLGLVAGLPCMLSPLIATMLCARCFGVLVGVCIKWVLCEAGSPIYTRVESPKK